MCSPNEEVFKNKTKNETKLINTEELPNKFKLLWEWTQGKIFYKLV